MSDENRENERAFVLLLIERSTNKCVSGWDGHKWTITGRAQSFTHHAAQRAMLAIEPFIPLTYRLEVYPR